jgi:hypothetical protein
MPAFMHLAIRRDAVSPPLFKILLFRHTETLQSLEIHDTNSFTLLLDERAYHSSNLDERKALGDEEQPNAKSSERRLKLIAPEDYTSFSVFEQLTTFPSLINVRFARLRQHAEEQSP